MGLSTHLIIHFLSSILAAVITYIIWQQPLVSLIPALIGGFFIDFDHLLDYFFTFGFNFKLKYFFNGYQFLKSGKSYILFHAFEYVLILLISLIFIKSNIAKSAILSFALGLFFHLLFDTYVNEFNPKSYFILYRLRKHFKLPDLVSTSHYKKYLVERKKIKLSN